MANEILAKLIGDLISSGVNGTPASMQNPDFNSTAVDPNTGQVLDKYTGLPATSAEQNAAPYKQPTYWQRAFPNATTDTATAENNAYYQNPINAAQARGIHSQDMAAGTQDTLGRAALYGGATGDTAKGLYIDGTLSPTSLDEYNTVGAKGAAG